MAEPKFDDCICSFAELLGKAKSQAVTLIDGLIGLLQVLKTTLLLFMIDIEDEGRKLIYEAELEVLNIAVQEISAPFGLVLSYTRVLADCDPVASFAETLKKVRDDVLSDFYDKQYEVEQYIAALSDKKREIEIIDKKIQMLTEIRDALDACGGNV